MPIPPPVVPPSFIAYTPATLQRADRALRCSPFELSLFMEMRQNSVPLGAIAGSVGVDRQYTRRPLSELVTERALLWLIEVGILRREVDGQGITDSFRLTPLGHQLIEQWQNTGTPWPSPSGFEHLRNWANYWFRLSLT